MSKKISIRLLEKKYLDFLSTQEIQTEPFYNKLGQLKNFYLPICEKIYHEYKKNKKIKIVGLTGGQGSGKSTIAQILKLIFNNKYNLSVSCFSIDDFYKTLKERKKLSKNTHELFETRGVPGTHDTKLLNKTFSNLIKKKFKPVLIPRFDKSRDNRFPQKKWQKINQQPQIIIFEGWCVGAKPQVNRDLIRPINILEKKRDSNLTWRKKVNNELKNEYKKIFNKIDNLVFLKVPNFECVYKWRLLQEKKLQLTSRGKKIMSAIQVNEFIMYYERTTKQMLKDLTNKAYAVLYLDNKHKLSRIKFN
jgi:D-glycerate 3-kinase|tara:strand:- start:2097 stop:3011 length:915 start_codon:yes stop_codon:yes gene_type:complete